MTAAMLVSHRQLCKRRLVVVVVVVVVLLVMTSWWLDTAVTAGAGNYHGDVTSVRRQSAEEVAGGEDDLHRELTQRRNHYQAVCEDLQGVGGVPGLVQNPLVYLPANLSLCWVPKVGCTFWRRIFFFLHNDTSSPWWQRPVTSPLHLDRIFVHFDGGHKAETLRFNDAREREVIFRTRRVMFARDPWSRLWSDYVDKFVLPDSWLDHGHTILRLRRSDVSTRHAANVSLNVSRCASVDSDVRRLKCADDVSFAEFLQYTLVSHDAHWSPVHLTCNPCLFRPDFLGKMETFSTDAAHVLRVLGLGQLLGDLGHARHVADEVQLLSDYHFRLWERRRALHRCLDRQGLARRLWRAFQLNGYIPESSAFPASTASFAHRLKSATPLEARDLFTRHVLRVVSSAGSRSDTVWRALRRKVMARAYRGVEADVLRAIQDRFSLDFQLFGYDPSPPDLSPPVLRHGDRPLWPTGF